VPLNFKKDCVVMAIYQQEKPISTENKAQHERQNPCGSELARDGGRSGNIDVACTGRIAGKPAPTG
jgi:hypothetical protein